MTLTQAGDPASNVPAAAPRLDYIDGLRAIAALWVVLHHAIETSVPTTILKVPLLGPTLGSLFLGQAPVMVFLMLSGFCLYYPCVRKQPASPELPGLATYIRRRWVRIAPPYLWAGAFCLPLAAFPSVHVGKWADVSTLDPSVIISHVLLLHNLIPDHITKIDYPMWSIGLEWQMYLVFPVLVWAFRRWGALTTVALTLVLVVAVRATFRYAPPALSHALIFGPFAYLEIFASGMLAAVLAVKASFRLPTWALSLVAVGCLAAVRMSSGNGLAHDVAATLATLAVLQLALDPMGRVSRFLSAPWLVRIGLFSYSLYLVHAPLLHLFWLVVRRTGLSDDLIFVVLCVVGVPITMAGSYAFHCVFERPFMRLAPTSMTPNRAQAA
jgi:peptidoglycan/LPS O-acetylase OafA/YrhL